MNPLLKRLGLSEISPFFDECYEAALEEPGLPIHTMNTIIQSI